MCCCQAVYKRSDTAYNNQKLMVTIQNIQKMISWGFCLVPTL